MTATIKMSTIQGVRDAQKIEEREYREIEDAGLAVARGGRIYADEDFPEIDDFPYLSVLRPDGIYRAHVPAAVALAWLTPKDRDMIRAEITAGLKGSDPRVKEMVGRYNVWGWAIAHVASTTEDDLRVLSEKPIQDWSGREVRRMTDVQIEDYKTWLFEHSRPPSKGGNTSAMHVHTIWVGEQKLSFFARGARKFIFKDDLASFDYVETEDGYLNILPRTIICRDAKGKAVQRGDRRSKPVLRTAPTRLPGSRREARS